jgi:DNA helicase-2/ATP-dependent DNA helicase PcrA
MTRARKRLILTWARYRRRFGGGEQERSTPSWFLSEVPEHLIVNLGSQDEPGEVNLHGERHEVRETARRNTFTGKTYNSLENISSFFGERGIPFNGPRLPAGQQPKPQPPPPRANGGPLRQPVAPAPPARRGARPGAVVDHPKYGTGTVVRREGEGEDAKITVNFPRFGLKKLVEKYAGLKKS